MHLVSADVAARSTYDFIVVGSGSAGAVLAARLAEDPTVSVCLLEAGGHASHLSARMPLMAGRIQRTTYDWAYTTEPSATAYQSLTDRRSRWPRGKNLGGSSVTNYMAYVRGCRQDFDTWARDFGAQGWAWDDVLPFFIKSEDLLRVGEMQARGEVDVTVHGTGGPLGVSPLCNGSQIAEDFVRAAVECGFERRDYNAGKMDGVASLFQQTIRDGVRADVATAFLFGQEKRGNLTVVTYAQGTKLLFGCHGNEDQVVGVEVADVRGGSPCADRFEFRARKEVLLSCGAIGSPHLLMLSGIGPVDMLQRQGVKILVDAPDVGQQVEDHVAAIIRFATEKDIGSVNLKKAEGFPYAIPHIINWALTGRGMHASPCYDATLFFKTTAFAAAHPNYGPDAQISIFSSPADPTSIEQNLGLRDECNFHKPHSERDSEGFLMLPTALHPQAVSSIELVSADPFVYPKIVSNALDNTTDITAHIEMMRKCFDIAKAPAMKGLEAHPVMPKDLLATYNNDIYNEHLLEEYVRRYASTLYHPACSCKIGRVVDTKLCVIGVKGLRVVDASVMPAVISGNTNAPTIMIAERAAFFIKECYNLGDVNVCGAPKFHLMPSHLAFVVLVVFFIAVLAKQLLFDM